MVDTYVHDTTAYRKTKNWYVHDGSAWRKLKQAWCHDGSVWRKVFGKMAGILPDPTQSPSFMEMVSCRLPTDTISCLYVRVYSISSGLYRWNGSAWNLETSALATANNYSLAVSVSGDKIYGGVTSGLAGNVLIWNGTIVSYVGPLLHTGPFTSSVNAVYDDPVLGLVAHKTGSQNSAHRVQYWNGTVWNSLGVFPASGGGSLRVLIKRATDLFVMIPLATLTKWDGTAWVSVACPSVPYSIEEMDGYLYGGFNTGLYRLEGTTWVPVYTGAGVTIVSSIEKNQVSNSLIFSVTVSGVSRLIEYSVAGGSSDITSVYGGSAQTMAFNSESSILYWANTGSGFSLYWMDV